MNRPKYVMNRPCPPEGGGEGPKRPSLLIFLPIMRALLKPMITFRLLTCNSSLCSSQSCDRHTER